MNTKIQEAARVIKNSQHTIVFTGAGISVESGMPPFRGEHGLWNKYDPNTLDINYFYAKPKESWEVIKEIFFDFFGTVKPNQAHILIGELEKKGYVKSVITQNIDNLHQEGGSETVYEFHGNSRQLICTKCEAKYDMAAVELQELPPKCESCGGLLKPDFIFFGEGIPTYAYNKSIEEAQAADVCLVVGTTGEVMPANMIPQIAKQNNATIIEINTEMSAFTNMITDYYLQGKAVEKMQELYDEIMKS